MRFCTSIYSLSITIKRYETVFIRHYLIYLTQLIILKKQFTRHPPRHHPHPPVLVMISS